MTTLVIATRNQHKVQEIRTILSKKFKFLTLNDFAPIPAPVEDGKTFSENAKKKAVHLAEWFARNPKSILSKLEDEEMRIFVLADDSGLEVDALNGAPGVFSARYAALDTGAAGNSPDAENNAKLLKKLEGVPAEKRNGRFRCAVAITQIKFGTVTRKPLVSTTDGLMALTKVFEGACEGKISTAPSGKDGFGYDPLFVPKGFDKSFAELGERHKNQASHRAKALELLRKYLAEA